MPTALVFGATGLVGRALVDLLLDDPHTDAVHTFGRRPLERDHPRLHEHLVDFGAPDAWADRVRGDEVYLALGTTRAAAGSLAARRVFDVDYSLLAARLARAGGATAAALVSSAGADPASRVPYSRMKGELEEGLRGLGFARLALIRPGILDGARAESRPGERLGILLLRPLRHLPVLNAWAPVPAATVARACRAALRDPAAPPVRVAQLGEVFALGDAG
jgi:uncharacterized protein YbjT (DUF2867 family)